MSPSWQVGAKIYGCFGGCVEDSLVAGAQAAGSVLVEHAAWAEQHGRLHESAIGALVEAGVPRLYLPKSLGGYEVTPATCAYVTECLADADPAAAWHVMVYNAARLMAATWPLTMVEKLWADNPDRLVAASGHTPFQGIKTKGGYRLTGRNSFVSGCHHAEYVLSPMVCDGALHFAALPMNECRIEDNWDSLGMRGSGSNDVSADAVLVDADLVAVQSPHAVPNRHYQGQLYRCPSRVVFATYIPVALSLARRALDELEGLAGQKIPYATDTKLKHRVQAQMHFGRGLGKYRSVRTYFYSTLKQVWERAGNEIEFTDRDRADLYLAGTHTLQTCAEVVRHVADSAGSSILAKGRPLEQIVRDMETLKHHGFANESRYASVAQVLWQAELDYPILLR